MQQSRAERSSTSRTPQSTIFLKSDTVIAFKRNGSLQTFSVRVHGSTFDSLTWHFMLRDADSTVLASRIWTSQNYNWCADGECFFASLTEADIERLMRAQLDSVLGSYHFAEPGTAARRRQDSVWVYAPAVFDSAGVASQLDDSASVALMRELAGQPTFCLYRGTSYEIMAWSPKLGQVVQLVFGP